MARVKAWAIYHEAPPKMAFTLAEGTWSDNDKYKDGGYFSAPLTKDCYVSLVTGTAYEAVVSKSASGSTPIGKLITEPMGKHETNGRQGTVLLFGTAVMEIEIATQSDLIVAGNSVKYWTYGGMWAEGLWTLDTVSNGTVLLATTPASGSMVSGTMFPCLFGAPPF